MRRIIFGVGVLFFFISCKEDVSEETVPEEVKGKATVFITSGNQAQLLAPDTTIKLIHKQAVNQGVTISLDDTDIKQEIEGFGAALTESSAYLLYTKLNTSQRANLLKEMFIRGFYVQ
jgi:glucosylceramidase